MINQDSNLSYSVRLRPQLRAQPRPRPRGPESAADRSGRPEANPPREDPKLDRNKNRKRKQSRKLPPKDPSSRQPELRSGSWTRMRPRPRPRKRRRRRLRRNPFRVLFSCHILLKKGKNNQNFNKHNKQPELKTEKLSGISKRKNHQKEEKNDLSLDC